MKKADPALVTRSALRFSALGAERACRFAVAAGGSSGGDGGGRGAGGDGYTGFDALAPFEKLKQVGLVKVRREGTYLWYAADTEALREVLNFLYEECCTRSRAVARRQ